MASSSECISTTQVKSENVCRTMDSPSTHPHRHCNKVTEDKPSTTEGTPCNDRDFPDGSPTELGQKSTKLAEEHTRRATQPAADKCPGYEEILLEDYPPMDIRSREEYTYARNRHTFASLFSRPSKDKVTQSALDGCDPPVLVQLPVQTARPIHSPHCVGPAESELHALPPVVAKPLWSLAERSHALAHARGENIARTNDIAFQLGATILRSFELVQMLIDLQHDRKSLDEGLIAVNASFNEHFQDHPKAAQLRSIYSSYLHHRTLGAIVNPSRLPPSPSSRHDQSQTPSASSQLSVSQIRHLGFSYSANPNAIANHVNEMWSCA